ncbi:ABC transporter ATP-binding protein [Actinotalea fermentans]|uniref:ABC transporter ATP-binding protein n=1 Tax=Actinotalea fermentans TaxID=43671 RepID=A0A511Z179_9CELL|nr:ATP-binding cassette domain-containing protein [Actinotalea fermentans]KGM15222.1 ABC transporter ATP-binding protein [Actinotalea fermentans ATCC 43279 = JCM 9966 = DSM 3133]GEN81194.1 ABC transporter ATP-binding protein [Actinotalea fermentans]
MLKIEGLNRSFGDRQVLHDITFDVARGRLTGFVGGNGAGKTTTMRIVLGVLAAESGSVTLDGHALTAADRVDFGYMPEERGLYPKMKVAEQVAYLGRLHGLDRGAAMDRARDLLDRLGLAERADDPLETLSLGNQQRAQIAAALVHDPQVLVLDEPFSGLDPLAVDVVVGVLAEYAASGVPVLFSSHQLELVERLCDDLVIISGGRIRAAGGREELRAAHGTTRFELVTDGDVGWVRSAPGVQVVDFDGGYALFEAAEDAAQAVLRDALARDAVRSFTPVRPTLGEIFREVVADEPELEVAR